MHTLRHVEGPKTKVSIRIYVGLLNSLCVSPMKTYWSLCYGIKFKYLVLSLIGETKIHMPLALYQSGWVPMVQMAVFGMDVKYREILIQIGV
jgi:hypothetical protein